MLRSPILGVARDSTSGQTVVTELAEPHDMRLPAISKHLRLLERSGLIERARDAQWRPCRLEAAPMKEAVDWLEKYRRHWEESLARLDGYLKQLQAKEKKHATKKSKLQREPAGRVAEITQIFRRHDIWCSKPGPKKNT